MGFASFAEDITDRFNESGSFFDSWSAYLGPKPERRDIEEARHVLGDPMERPRRIICDFWRYYTQHTLLAETPAGSWERPLPSAWWPQHELPAPATLRRGRRRHQRLDWVLLQNYADYPLISRDLSRPRTCPARGLTA